VRYRERAVILVRNRRGSVPRTLGLAIGPISHKIDLWCVMPSVAWRSDPQTGSEKHF
jgi:hypothetical protein